MKIKLDIENRTIECKREPMPPERFSALCKLVKTAIGGVVLLVGVHIVRSLVFPVQAMPHVSREDWD